MFVLTVIIGGIQLPAATSNQTPVEQTITPEQTPIPEQTTPMEILKVRLQFNSGLEFHGCHGLCCCPGLGLGAPYKHSQRHSDILMEVPFTQEKLPCPCKNVIPDLFNQFAPGIFLVFPDTHIWVYFWPKTRTNF